MTGMNFQFHADPHELLHELLPEWLAGLDIFMGAERFFPENRRVFFTGTNLATAEKELGTISRTFVRLSPFQAQRERAIGFMESNRDFMDVLPGCFSPKGAERVTNRVLG